MFEHSSRYYLLEDATYCTPDGREIRYKRRRFLPQGEKLPVARDVTTGEADRLDLLAANHLGDPLLFWHICDANNALDPAELTADYGQTLHIPIPQFEEPR